MIEDLENIKKQLMTVVANNYDRLEETDTVDDIIEAYDTIKYIISKLSIYEPEVFYGYRLI